jgi:hypothetical protein
MTKEFLSNTIFGESGIFGSHQGGNFLSSMSGTSPEAALVGKGKEEADVSSGGGGDDCVVENPVITVGDDQAQQHTEQHHHQEREEEGMVEVPIHNKDVIDRGKEVCPIIIERHPQPSAQGWVLDRVFPLRDGVSVQVFSHMCGVSWCDDTEAAAHQWMERDGGETIDKDEIVPVWLATLKEATGSILPNVSVAAVVPLSRLFRDTFLKCDPNICNGSFAIIFLGNPAGWTWHFRSIPFREPGKTKRRKGKELDKMDVETGRVFVLPKEYFSANPELKFEVLPSLETAERGQLYVILLYTNPNLRRPNPVRLISVENMHNNAIKEMDSLYRQARDVINTDFEGEWKDLVKARQNSAESKTLEAAKEFANLVGALSKQLNNYLSAAQSKRLSKPIKKRKAPKKQVVVAPALAFHASIMESTTLLKRHKVKKGTALALAVPRASVSLPLPPPPPPPPTHPEPAKVTRPAPCAAFDEDAESSDSDSLD